MNRIRSRWIAMAVLAVSACACAFAQANSELTGIVTDQTGAVVGGAKVTLTDPATGTTHATISGGTGLYDISGLNPSNYDIKVIAKGFETYEQKGVVVNVSSTVRSDIKLTIGAETQTVTVEADALAVQTDSNVVSTLISSEQISEIATENRNFAALAALGLGVSSMLPDSNTPTSVAANFGISVNGLRQSHNIWLIDGGEADDRGGGGGMDIMPSQDAIAEFSMLTSNYPPDYGISSGATMSLSLKSGTQKFHGEAWEFNRNTDYDANDFFNQYNGANTPRQGLHYNIFGANAGGPLFIPRVYNTSHQKTFFFWNEEWRKINQGSSPNVVATLPSQDIPTAGADLHYMSPAFAKPVTVNGKQINPGIVVPSTSVITDPDFAAKLKALNLTPGQPFPNNTIPHQLFDSNAVVYLNTGILPKPQTADGYAVSEAQTPISVRDDVVRIDHKVNDKWQIMGHYMHDAVTQNYGQPELGWLAANYNTVTSTLSNPSNSAAVKLSGTINPNLLVETSFNYDGNIINITNSSLADIPAGWSVQPFFQTGNPYLPGVTGFGNPYGTNEDIGSAPWHNAAQDFEPKIDVSYTSGKHALKFGFSYNRYTKNQQLFGDAEGKYAFGGDASGNQFTSNVGPCSGTSCVLGDGMMDMLLGLAASYSQYQAVPIRHYVNQTPSIYAMDNWHVTPRLSLQVGLRFDALPHAWERSNDLANFNPADYLSTAAPFWNSDGSMLSTGPGFQNPTHAVAPFYLNGMQLAGQSGVNRGLVTNDYATLQPRVGFSEDLFGNGKTVLRGGFGTFYERLQGNDTYNVATAAPFAFDPGATYVYMSNPSRSTLTGETAATPFFPQGITNLAQRYPAPAVAQFSLGVQHELRPSVIWVVQYVGNLAWHQNILNYENNFPLTTPMDVRAKGGNVTSVNGVTLPTSGQGWVANNSSSFRTYAGYGQIQTEENNTNGSYNGFQTAVRVQNRWGLSGELDYTWSHVIDITSNDLVNPGPSNPWNLKYDRGSGEFDRRNIVSANYMYKLPFFARATGLVHTLAGGWEIAGTFNDESGDPALSQYGGGDTIGLGGGYINRLNVAGKVRYPKHALQWFDPSQFTAPVAAWSGGVDQGFGNSGKDAIVGPGRVNFTTSLYKSFAVTERAHFEMRFESFNTFNHPQFNTIDTKNTDGNFGQVTSDWGPRTLELGGKFVF